MNNYNWVHTTGSLALAVICLLCTTLTHANLISMDSKYGLNTITFDVNTGLEWLDTASPFLDNSCCLSYNDVEAELGVGGDYEGFRFAQLSDIETLLFGSANIGSYSSVDDSNLGALINLLEPTDAYGYDKFLSALFDNDSTNSAGQLVLQISEDPEGFFGGSVDVFTNFELNSNYQNLGFLLVRNNNVEPVSAPSAALTGLLLLLIASWRRRHR